MSKISRFEDLVVWQESIQICIDIYEKLDGCQDFGFKNQITKAAVSVPSNISEGFERNSQKEFSRFLTFSKGSSGETRTQLYIGKALNYFTTEDAEDLISRSTALSKKLQALINSVEKTIKRCNYNPSTF